MRSKKLLTEIIEQVAAFEEATMNDTDLTLKNFLYFAHSNLAVEPDNVVEIHIAQYISLLHRYSKFYIKKTLKNTLLQTVDEYTYMAALYNVESLSKTELNNRNVMEKTSGNEIMNRLLKSGLIAQRRDEEDKRRMRVFLTEKGRNELQTLFPELRKTALIVSAVLSPNEKQILLKTLQSLNDFHRKIFVTHKESELNMIIDEIIQ